MTKPGPKRNWNELFKAWAEAGCPKLADFARQRGIPYSTMEKQARKLRWREKGEELAKKTQDLVAQSDAQAIAEQRKRLAKMGLAIQAAAIKRMVVTPANWIDAMRLGVKLETQGLYGPMGAQAGPLVAIQQNTLVFNEAQDILRSRNGGKERSNLEKALKELLGDGAP